jgi:hypothetical protein
MSNQLGSRPIVAAEASLRNNLQSRRENFLELVVPVVPTDKRALWIGIKEVKRIKVLILKRGHLAMQCASVLRLQGLGND